VNSMISRMSSSSSTTSTLAIPIASPGQWSG
jgi:hypothetical protein